MLSLVGNILGDISCNSVIYYVITASICFICNSRVGSETQLNYSSSFFLTWMSQKATKGLIALTPEIDCDQTASGLPPATSAVFLLAKQFC
jgi:hypothetical protein